MFGDESTFFSELIDRFAFCQQGQHLPKILSIRESLLEPVFLNLLAKIGKRADRYVFFIHRSAIAIAKLFSS
jgi:hypothetical protein